MGKKIKLTPRREAEKLAKLALLPREYHAKKRSKYLNVKTKLDGLDGVVFDSRKEANFYSELKLRKIAGEIKQIQRQVRYELIPAQYDINGKLLERSITYIADFVVEFNDGKIEVIDCKCKKIRFPVWVIKRKLMLYIHDIRVLEV